MIKKIGRLLFSGIIAVTGTIGYLYEYKFKSNQFKKDEVIQDIYQEPWKIRLLTLMPYNFCSRAWGKINSYTLPESLRNPLLSLYIKKYGCNMDEVTEPNLKYYKNLGEFFRRKLKPELRPIDQKHTLVSPCDGTILSVGRVDGNLIQQVKGKTYNLDYFLGSKDFLTANLPTSFNETHLALSKSLQTNRNIRKTGKNGEVVASSSSRDSDLIHGTEEFEEVDYRVNKSNCLYQCVIYLSPGDYHCFHSPADWSCALRRYFPGYLISVSPRRASTVPQLFNLNERVVYYGAWTHGFFSLAAIGATNVGSIRVYADPTLSTNKKRIEKSNLVEKAFPKALSLNKGDIFGEFNFGSTIVLIFEAPSDFEFTKKAGSTIKYGQALG